MRRLAQGQELMIGLDECTKRTGMGHDKCVCVCVLVNVSATFRHFGANANPRNANEKVLGANRHTRWPLRVEKEHSDDVGHHQKPFVSMSCRLTHFHTSGQH